MARSRPDTNENTSPPMTPTPTNKFSMTPASSNPPDTQKIFEDAEDEDEEIILGSCSQAGLSESNFKRDNPEVAYQLWPLGLDDSRVIGSEHRENEEGMNNNEGMGNGYEEQVPTTKRLSKPRPLTLIIDVDMDTEKDGRMGVKDILGKKEDLWTKVISPAIEESLPGSRFCRLHKQNESTESSPPSTKDVTSRPLQRYDPPNFHNSSTNDLTEPSNSAEGDNLQPSTPESHCRLWPTSFIELRPSDTDESRASLMSTFIIPKDASCSEIHIITRPRANVEDQTRDKMIIRPCGCSSSLQTKAVEEEVGIGRGIASPKDGLLLHLGFADAYIRVKPADDILMAEPDVEYKRGLTEGKLEQAENTKGLLLLLVVVFSFAGLDIWLSGAMLMVLVGIGKVIGFL